MNTYSLYVALLLAVLSRLDLAVAVDQVGLWSRCYSAPASDAFLAPDGNIPAYASGRYGKAVKGNKCLAYTANGGENTWNDGSFVYLRKYNNSESANDYKWVNYGKYLSGEEHCEPVKYGRSDTQVCYLHGMHLRERNGNWIYKDTLGFCWNNREAWTTYQGNQFEEHPSWAYGNAEVLCLARTTRMEVTIQHVDPITSGSLVHKPDLYLHDGTINRGSTTTTLLFKKTYVEEISSDYSTEHGWKVGVSTTIHSGVLASAVADFETTISVEGHGNYAFGKGVKHSSEITYQRTFEVPKYTNYQVSLTISKQELDVRYRALEKYYDEDDNLLSQQEVWGTWKGVTTIRGDTNIVSTPIPTK
ncbi:Hypothetical predicted protein [Paramuricea clavata]|uniref:Uncharacterized protein n=2 Tax=Paramuricea clavata TaxID=317549 RepID=A0A6S7G9G5_PARCT|nr:Hypothetical predicted protein [Paramuricea clavata]